MVPAELPPQDESRERSEIAKQCPEGFQRQQVRVRIQTYSAAARADAHHGMQGPKDREVAPSSRLSGHHVNPAESRLLVGEEIWSGPHRTTEQIYLQRTGE